MGCCRAARPAVWVFGDDDGRRVEARVLRHVRWWAAGSLVTVGGTGVEAAVAAELIRLED